MTQQRDHGDLAQTPAADRDRNQRHADHDRKQRRRIRDRQQQALRAAYRPDDDDGEDMFEASDAQNHRAVRSEKDTAVVCGI